MGALNCFFLYLHVSIRLLNQRILFMHLFASFSYAIKVSIFKKYEIEDNFVILPFEQTIEQLLPSC